MVHLQLFGPTPKSCVTRHTAIGSQQTGQPIVLVRLALLDGQTGAVTQVLNPNPGSTSVWTHQEDLLSGHLGGFYDIDDDSTLEIIEGIPGLPGRSQPALGAPN